jgi:hypothetical protein
MAKKIGIRVMGLRLGGAAGAWAVLDVRPGNDRPVWVVNAGPLDDNIEMIENLLQGVDFLAWERLILNDHTDAVWAFAHGRTQGRVEGIARRMAPNARAVDASAWRARGWLEDDGAAWRELTRDEKDAAAIAYDGWVDPILKRGIANA